MKKRYRHLSGKWICGIPVTYCTEIGAYKTYWLCDRWDCETCRKHLIAKYIKRITDSMNHFAGVHVFVSVVHINAKKFSKWRQKNLSRIPYWRIRSKGKTEEKTTIIAARTVPGANRRDKRHFMEKILPTILAEPWEMGRRISCSHSISQLFPRPNRDNIPVHYCFIPEDKEYEYKRLKTEEDIANWLSQQPIKQLFTAGRELLRKHGYYNVDSKQLIHTVGPRAP